MRVLSLCVAVVTLGALWGAAAGQEPEIHVDEGACPGEGCEYGRWRAQSDVVVYDRPSDGGAAIGVISAGIVRQRTL